MSEGDRLEWARARALFDELAELDVTERARRLGELEPDMQAELRPLLKSLDEGGAFDAIAGRLPHAGGGSEARRTSAEAIDSLATLLTGRYEIVREIGEGGMSVVYLAEDLRHERQVALKVLKPELAALVGAGRFLEEIRTTANLQHPHVLPLFDSGEADGFLYYVMPFVQNESLRQRLDREHQLPVADALQIASDVAQALEYAHGAGVVHRDIKPENILLTAGGALVADFGVALLLTDERGGDRRTEQGVRVGTPRYMSPEQATGSHGVGPATDVYALGCVLYEMLAGVPPHRGRTLEAVIAERVSGAHSSVSEYRPSVPQAVEAAIARALQPIPADRHRSAADFASALAAPAAGDDSPPTVGSLVRWLGPVAAAAAIAGVVWVATREPTVPGPSGEPVARQVTFEGDVLNASISPDGSQVAYVAGREGMDQRVAIQSVDGGPATVVHRSSQLVYNPQWSLADGALAFTQGLVLRTWVLDRPYTGQPEPVSSTHVYASWAPDGDHLVGWSAKRAEVAVLDLSTRTTVDSIALGIPIEWVLGVSWANTRDWLALSIVAEGLDGIWTLDLDSHALTPLVRDSTRLRHPIWSNDDRSMYYARSPDAQNTEIWALPVGSDGEREGAPRRVFGPVPMSVRHGIQPPFSISTDGARLLYVESLGVSNLTRVDVGPDGVVAAMQPLTSGTAERTTPRLAPDGTTVAYIQSDTRGSHVATMDLADREPRRVTFLEGRSWSPAWSDDGGRVAFGANHEGSSVWTVEVGDGTTTMVEGIEYEPENHVAWGALPGILVQTPGDRRLELVGVDPDSNGSTEPSGDTALVYDLRPSPSGRRVALHGGDDPQNTLWIEELDGSGRTPLRAGYVPIGWTAEEDAVYAMPGLRTFALTEIHIVPLSGDEPRPWVTLPFGAKPWEVSISTDGRTIVAAVEEPRTDAWIVDEFDARAR